MKTRILIAGLAGGIAGILWVLAYSAVAPVAAAEVAREVTASIVPVAAAWAVAPAIGVALQLALSIAVAALVAVWAFNFLVLMPLLDMRFATLMPYAATLLSKVLFGVAMGSVLARSAPRLARPAPASRA
ncbi:MAG TPA: hypothetical protein VML57_03840 [Burkholderiales bacterium]|nr:hypothetical protein [Burkholderiales bacterium]